MAKMYYITAPSVLSTDGIARTWFREVGIYLIRGAEMKKNFRNKILLYLYRSPAPPLLYIIHSIGFSSREGKQ